MKNLKTLTLGFVLGASCMVATTAIAAGVNVTAAVPGDITFKIDGNNVATDSDQPVLMYNDKVYVPLKFLNDKLGWETNWNILNRQVEITSPPPKEVIKEVVKEVEKIQYVNESEAPGAAKVYSSLPMRKTTADYSIEVNGVTVSKIDQRSKIFVRLENLGNDRLQIDQNNVKVIVDGKEYGMSPLFSEWDAAWYSDLHPEKYHEGFLLVKPFPEDYKEVTVEIPVRVNAGGNPRTETVEFNFKR